MLLVCKNLNCNFLFVDLENLHVDIVGKDNTLSELSQHALSFTNLAYATSNSCVSVFEDLKNSELDKNEEVDKNEVYKKEAQQILAQHEKVVLSKDSNQAEVLISQEVSDTGRV